MDDNRSGGERQERRPRREDGARDRRDDRGAGRREERSSGPRDEHRDSRGSNVGRAERNSRGNYPDTRGGGGGRRDWEDRPPRRDWEDRPARPRDPELPEGVDAGGLDRSVRSELRTLSKENAEGVGGHLVMVGRALDAEDFDMALAHAEAASRRAGRVAIVRESLGLVHYRRGEWAKALAEFRTARRLSGTHHLIPLMADCERGLERPERALELATTAEAKALPANEQVELAIVVAGARGDLGQHSAGVLHLSELVRRTTDRDPWAARLRYAYGAALEADGEQEQALQWYAKAAAVDHAQETDAAQLLGAEESPWVVDLSEDDDDDGAPPAPEDRPRR